MDPNQKKTNKIKSESQTRSISLRFKAVDTDKRTVPAAISSEATVRRWFGNERILHTEKAVNLERAGDGLPLLFNHNQNSLIGRANNIHLDDGVLRADLTFSENSPLADQIFRDVSDKFIRDVSLGYRIEKYKDIKGGIEATRWSPFEVSIAAVAADHTVGINRTIDDQGDQIMDPNDNNTGDGNTIVDDVNQNHQLGVNAGMKLEQTRQAEIRAVFVRFEDNTKAVDIMKRCLSDYRITVDAARSELLTLLSDGFEPTQAPATGTHAEVGLEDRDKFARAAEDAIAVRAGIETDDKVILAVRSGDLMSFNLVQIAREFLVRAGVSTRGLDEMGVVGQAFRISGAHSSSDFPAILENVANKSMAKGYAAVEQTWRRWAAIGSVSDFKTTNFVTLSEFSDLEVKAEGAEYKHGMYKDKKEQLGISTLAKMFAITREAIINDDLGALSRAPQGMGQAAGRAVEALAYVTFLANPTLLEDSKTVFHADHNNIGSAGAISEALLDALRRLMAAQKGVLNQAGKTKGKASTQLLNIPAKTLLVPKTLELTANKLMVAEYATNDLSNPNMIRGAFDVVASPYLDASSTTAYYLLADANQYDTVMMAFLNGNQIPYLESQQGWNVDGIEYKVRIDVGAAWLDFRGAAKNAGA